MGFEFFKFNKGILSIMLVSLFFLYFFAFSYVCMQGDGGMPMYSNNLAREIYCGPSYTFWTGVNLNNIAGSAFYYASAFFTMVFLPVILFSALSPMLSLLLALVYCYLLSLLIYFIITKVQNKIKKS